MAHSCPKTDRRRRHIPSRGGQGRAGRRLGLLVLAVSLAAATRGEGHEPAPRADQIGRGLEAADTPAVDNPAVMVALDPGHGGSNLGAAGPGRGVYEKAVTLALAQRVRALLSSSGRPAISVVLCRDADVLVPIRARARCAAESGARAFISLHANAVPAGVRPGSQRGFEVFVLGPREVEDDATLAALEHRDDADAVWAAHEVRAAAEQSIALGRLLDGALTAALGSGARRGVKQAGAALDVLRGTGTAAALVEVGFLDDPVEGPRLATAAGREAIAQALATAIRAYVAHDPTATPAPVATQ